MSTTTDGDQQHPNRKDARPIQHHEPSTLCGVVRFPVGSTGNATRTAIDLPRSLQGALA